MVFRSGCINERIMPNTRRSGSPFRRIATRLSTLTLLRRKKIIPMPRTRKQAYFAYLVIQPSHAVTELG